MEDEHGSDHFELWFGPTQADATMLSCIIDHFFLLIWWFLFLVERYCNDWMLMTRSWISSFLFLPSCSWLSCHAWLHFSHDTDIRWLDGAFPWRSPWCCGFYQCAKKTLSSGWSCWFLAWLLNYSACIGCINVICARFYHWMKISHIVGKRYGITNVFVVFSLAFLHFLQWLRFNSLWFLYWSPCVFWSSKWRKNMTIWKPVKSYLWVNHNHKRKHFSEVLFF